MKREMGYNTALTEWPAMQIPEAVRQHINKFFFIMDTNAPGAGDRLAEEIFAGDGVMDSLHRAEGTEAIRRSRDDAWKLIDTRRHELLKIYTDSYAAEDLLIIGQVTVGLKDGVTKRGEFVARIVIAGGQTDTPKIKLYKVWMDHSALREVRPEK